MIRSTSLPKLITFDGEARSGKGTIVSRVKDHLRDELGYKVMLIDAGQVFRCLVVAATNRGIDLDDPAAIDAFLGDDTYAEECVGFVKAVYHMQKIDRDALLYTDKVGADSAKIGARPLSQSFKDALLQKWLRDAGAEGFDIVLLDGRALEEVGNELESIGLCTFIAGLYFTCDPRVGAMRTLGYALRPYETLSQTESSDVDKLVAQIEARNYADRTRQVQPIVPPGGARTFALPHVTQTDVSGGRFMAIIDTSAQMDKEQMSQPIIDLVAAVIGT